MYEKTECPIIPDKQHFIDAYNQEKATALKWTLGTVSSELLELISKDKIPTGSRILDVGCGVGTEAVFLAIREMKVTAIDISEAALEIGRQLANVYDVPVEFRLADVLSLPFENQSFNVVTDRGCFHCLDGDERKRYALEINRVCISGGIFILRCFSENNDTTLRTWVRPSRSQDLLNLFSPLMDLEKLERIYSLPKPGSNPSEAWFSVWKKR